MMKKFKCILFKKNLNFLTNSGSIRLVLMHYWTVKYYQFQSYMLWSINKGNLLTIFLILSCCFLIWSAEAQQRSSPFDVPNLSSADSSSSTSNIAGWNIPGWGILDANRTSTAKQAAEPIKQMRMVLLYMENKNFRKPKMGQLLSRLTNHLKMTSQECTDLKVEQPYCWKIALNFSKMDTIFLWYKKGMKRSSAKRTNLKYAI